MTVRFTYQQCKIETTEKRFPKKRSKVIVFRTSFRANKLTLIIVSGASDVENTRAQPRVGVVDVNDEVLDAVFLVSEDATRKTECPRAPTK